MELLIQKLLKEGITREELLDKHGIHIKPVYNGKHSLVYDQIKAKENDPVAQECRGLILREKTWDIVAFPFRRFFNYNQHTAAQIDWKKSSCQNKLDGSLIIVYWDDLKKSWCCATRSMCEAQSIGAFGYTFYELVHKTLVDMGFDSLNNFMYNVSKNYTLMFELTAPENRVVCQYSKRKLTLLGVRDLISLKEIDPKPIASLLKVNLPKTWELNSLYDVLDFVNNFNPIDYEGIVVCDHNFNRIKIKSPKYLVAHHSIDSLGASWKSVIEAVVNGNSDDLEDLLPVFIQDRINLVKSKLNDICDKTQDELQKIIHIEDQKEFALSVKNKTWPAAMFAIKRGKCNSAMEFTKCVTSNHLMHLLGFKNE